MSGIALEVALIVTCVAFEASSVPSPQTIVSGIRVEVAG